MGPGCSRVLRTLWQLICASAESERLRLGKSNKALHCALYISHAEDAGTKAKRFCAQKSATVPLSARFGLLPGLDRSMKKD